MTFLFSYLNHIYGHFVWFPLFAWCLVLVLQILVRKTMNVYSAIVELQLKCMPSGQKEMEREREKIGEKEREKNRKRRSLLPRCLRKGSPGIRCNASPLHLSLSPLSHKQIITIEPKVAVNMLKKNCSSQNEENSLTNFMSHQHFTSRTIHTKRETSFFHVT